MIIITVAIIGDKARGIPTSAAREATGRRGEATNVDRAGAGHVDSGKADVGRSDLSYPSRVLPGIPSFEDRSLARATAISA